MVQEYSPKKIEIDFRNRFAIVTMNSTKDLNELLTRFTEFCQTNYPKFMIQPFIERNYYEINRGINPLVQQGIPISKMAHSLNPMIEQFSNLSIGRF